ncbi:MAG: DUF4194 domain-containing protein [Spirochaetaceae bacterium]|jgi:hypothetical protein|nr:DUF4194 domain-containing protein [Spirochaetaceae bacterium]
MLDGYEKLSGSEKEDFRRLANYLLSHTYMARHEYQPSQHMTLPNPDYQAVSRHFNLFKEYFELSGWRLEKDDNYGVISISNDYEHNRAHLNRFTTLFLYMCRLIYEERREDAGTYKAVPANTAEVVEKMRTLGLLERGKTGKATTKRDRAEAQRALAHFNIIRKMESASWDGDGNKFLILPSILSIIPNQSINTVYTEIENMKAGGAADDADDGADGADAEYRASVEDGGDSGDSASGGEES